ncbi:MAG: DUF3617 family protein [Betaproteobacteria bacterium]|nr:DUF3617 family protein [Betaproteobacteria bacterium]
MFDASTASSPIRLARAAALGVVAFALAATAQAMEVPKRKPGLWEIRTQTSAAPMGTTIQNCIDDKTDDLLRQRGEQQAAKSCSRQDMRRDGERWIVDSVCDVSGSKAVTHGEFSGRFDSSYRGEMVTTFTPPVMNMKQATTTIEGRWVGPCKPGQKPGDVIMAGPGGGTINMKEMTDPKKMQEMMKQMNEAMKNMPRPAQ